LKLEAAKEIEVPSSPGSSRSKYRKLLEEFINSDLTLAKITCKYPAEAQFISHGLRNWLSKEDKIIVFQRGYVVYLKKLS